MKEIILTSEQTRAYCQTMLSELKLDGSETVIFKKTDKSPTARQRRLRWLWMTEIAQSGLGKHDIKEDVDLACKWKFGLPILLRDDDTFALIYNHFMSVVETYSDKSEVIKKFARDYISIEKLMSRRQEAEYLTEVQGYWIRRGVNLTNLELQGVDLKKGKMK